MLATLSRPLLFSKPILRSTLSNRPEGGEPLLLRTRRAGSGENPRCTALLLDQIQSGFKIFSKLLLWTKVKRRKKANRVERYEW